MGSDAVTRCRAEHARARSGSSCDDARAGVATATTIPAALLGHSGDLAIAPGHFADLVAVDGDPLTDINVVINKVRVMKGAPSWSTEPGTG
jgi:hypothetical protein